MHENYIFIYKHFKANGFEISTRLQKSQACPFGFAQGLEHCRNGSRLTLSTSPEPVEGLTSKSLDFARDLEPVETVLWVTYS